MITSMTHRERIIKTFLRETPDKVPVWIQPGKHLMNLVKENVGSINPQEYFDFDIQQLVRYKPSSLAKYKENVNEWGIEKGFQGKLPPMREIGCVKEIYEYSYPDLGEFNRYKHLIDINVKLKGEGLPVVSSYEPGTFEQINSLRGMDNFLVDLIREPKFLKPLIEKVSDIKSQIASNYAKTGVDILWIGDDLGTQRSMIMDPELWRKYLKPAVKKIIQNAKEVKSDIIVAFHSDGYIEPIITDLIDVGVDVLQAVQPNCMNVVELKNKYGNKLSFWGTIDAQNLIPLGEPKEIMKNVKKRIKTVGGNGGLCIAPAHTLESPTPWENVIAFVEAAKKYGSY